MVQAIAVPRDQYKILEKFKGSYGASAQAFITFLKDGKRPLNDQTVLAYVTVLKAELKDNGIAAATYNTRLSAMKSIVREAYKNAEIMPHKDYMAMCASLDLQKPMKRELTVDQDNIPTLDEYRKVLEQCEDGTVRLVIEFLGTTGCRISEALSVLLTDVKSNHRFVTITIRGKRNKERKVKIPMKLYEAVRSYFKGKRLLFEHSGKEYNRASMTARIKYQTLKLVGQEYSAHAFRHMFATEHAKAGHSYSAISRYLGHSDAGTTLSLYAHDTLSFEELEVITSG